MSQNFSRRLSARAVRRLGSRAGVAAGAAGALVLLGSAPAWANTITIPQQGGNHTSQMTPGQYMFAGYDFQYPGQPNNYPAGAITTFANGQALLSVTCKDGSTPTQSSVVVPMPVQQYDGTVGSNGWYPSGNQASPLVYQGSLPMPDLCHGGTMVVGQQMGPFSAEVYSTDLVKLSARWHYGPGGFSSTYTGSGTSWSATKSIIPDPANQIPAGAVGAMGVALAGGTALGLRQLRRRRRVSRPADTASA